jgi:16S rRNA (guanine527-N7)-methyltransferase
MAQEFEVTDMAVAASTPQRDFEGALLAACSSISVTVTAKQVGKFWAHFERVLAANARFNLTRITEPAAAAVKHYADSLSLLVWPVVNSREIRRVIDVGTGAGFPAVPLAIVRPDWQITAVDSTGKKADFVAGVAEEFGLTNLRARKHRAGEPLRDDRPYDLALFRAVARLPVCLEAARGLVRKGGFVVCYKSADVAEAEWAAAKRYFDKGVYALAAQVPITLQGQAETLNRQLNCFRRT